jgi:hypothetical protein
VDMAEILMEKRKRRGARVRLARAGDKRAPTGPGVRRRNEPGTNPRQTRRIASCSHSVPAFAAGDATLPSPPDPLSRSMRTYLITHDQAASAKHTLSAAIMQLGEAWARPLEATWYVQCKERADALEARLSQYLDGEDGLLIQQVEAEAVLLNTSLRWFRKRQANAGELSNVVAFPLRAASEAKAA